jgi:hypothetical protein
MHRFPPPSSTRPVSLIHCPPPRVPTRLSQSLPSMYTLLNGTVDACHLQCSLTVGPSKACPLHCTILHGKYRCLFPFLVPYHTALATLLPHAKRPYRCLPRPTYLSIGPSKCLPSSMLPYCTTLSMPSPSTSTFPLALEKLAPSIAPFYTINACLHPWYPPTRLWQHLLPCFVPSQTAPATLAPAFVPFHTAPAKIPPYTDFPGSSYLTNTGSFNPTEDPPPPPKGGRVCPQLDSQLRECKSLIHIFESFPKRGWDTMPIA